MTTSGLGGGGAQLGGWCTTCGRYRGDRTIRQLAQVAAIPANISPFVFDECACAIADVLVAARNTAVQSGAKCFCDSLRTYVVEGILDSAQLEDGADHYPPGLRIAVSKSWEEARDLSAALDVVYQHSSESVVVAVEQALLARFRL